MKTQKFKKAKENFGLYKPTQEKLEEINKDCYNADCISQAMGDTSWPCRKCKVSNSFEKLTGIRLEMV